MKLWYRFVRITMFDVRDAASFQARPDGGFVAGESWFYFAVDPTLSGGVLWGKPGLGDIEGLVRLLVRELARPRHSAIVDFEHLEGVDPHGFDALARYTRDHHAALTRRFEHVAFVMPRDGVNAAIVAGFFDVVSRPVPVSFWPSAEAALAHLGRNDAEALAEALRAVRARISSEPELLRQLRAHLSARPTEASLPIAARALGVSERTLQRRLAELATSFEAVVQDVRLAVAEGLLSETDVPVTTIALDLGFRTAQHFSTLFRKRTGFTPSAFRAHRRGTQPTEH
jgi:AraC-like DNA-binding protein